MSLVSETGKQGWIGRASEAIVLALFRRLANGSLTLVLPSGQRHVFQGTGPGPNAVLDVRRPRFIRRLLSGGVLGFAESYMDGDCDTPDLVPLIHLGLCNEGAMDVALYGRPWVRGAQRLWHRLRPNSRSGAHRNIAYHYDLGNAFYAQWLDPGMTYSSALFADDGDDLEAAQIRKYRVMAETAALAPGQEVLEIGCGWGGFAIHAARENGCKVTAITISEQQQQYAARRVHEAGLCDKVEVRLQDYRDVPEQYDRIVSIEMFEAVGEAYWPAFFQSLRRRLKPQGRAGLQIITIEDAVWEEYRRATDFIQRYIFPGGLLPSPEAFRRAAAQAGLLQRDARSQGRHYATTLRQWHRRFDAAWPAIAALGFDERFRRMWKFYLAYCQGGFEAGRIDVRQLALVNG